MGCSFPICVARDVNVDSKNYTKSQSVNQICQERRKRRRKRAWKEAFVHVCAAAFEIIELQVVDQRASNCCCEEEQKSNF